MPRTNSNAKVSKEKDIALLHLLKNNSVDYVARNCEGMSFLD